ncbi:MAG TPA: methyltransferase [Gammaproteobacteria bacterium]|nr:methyltransferase [Gammaproteobacteria bacterium]
MKAVRFAWLPLAALAVGALASVAQAQDEQEARMRAALASPERSAENKARDEARKPIETIKFVGIKTGDTVVDVFAAGGWFTEVLSAAVGPKGKVYSQNPAFMTQRGGDEFKKREDAMVKRLGNVEPIHGDLPDGIAGKADAAITALNFHDMHNRSEEAGVQFLKGIYDSLKPGGVLGLIDHVGIAGQNNAEFHRVEPDAAKAALKKVGFVIEAESDILKNPADDHKKGVRDPSIRYHTDQFLIRARKPK